MVNLKYSNNSIKFYVSENLRKNTFYFKRDKLIINNDFFKQSREVVFRSFLDVIKSIGNRYYYVRGKKMDKVIDEIQDNRLLKATLGGCIIKKVNQTVIITKEC